MCTDVFSVFVFVSLIQHGEGVSWVYWPFVNGIILSNLNLKRKEWKSSKKASKVDRVFIDAASINISLHYARLNPLKRQKNWKCCFGLLLFFVNWVAAPFADGTKRRKSEAHSFSCELLNWHIAWQNKRQNYWSWSVLWTLTFLSYGDVWKVGAPYNECVHSTLNMVLVVFVARIAAKIFLSALHGGKID